MTLTEIITNINVQEEESIIFATKLNGKFQPASEAIILKITEDELEIPMADIAKKYCPGFDYFLEVFLAKEMLEDLNTSIGFKFLDQQINRIIHYAEFDA